MYRKKLRMLGLLLAVFALGSILLAACVRPGTATSSGGGATPTSTSSSGGGGASSCANGVVHTLATTFKESCVNVAKGAKLQIIPSVTSFHNLSNGSWVNGNQELKKEPGAPTINNVQVTGSPVSIGPFNTAGTFHILCTVHPGMDLTINVK
jgi:plastocyanin